MTVGAAPVPVVVVAPPAVVPVVVDPYLAKHLRPHQVEGVQFMYR